MPGQNSAGLPVVPVINPLNASDQETLDAVIAKAKEIQDLIQRAAHAGVDTTNHAQRNQMHVDVANRLKEMFFPQAIGSAIPGAPETSTGTSGQTDWTIYPPGAPPYTIHLPSAATRAEVEANIGPTTPLSHPPMAGG